MRLLIHVCCACCLAKTLAGLREEWGESLEAEGLFTNPNIHPLLEFRRRLKAVKVYLERDPVPVRFDESYGLISFCQTLGGEYAAPERCMRCYEMRLSATAEAAARGGFDAFTSTLVTSGHQDHGHIRAAGEAAGTRHGVPFLYRDRRDAKAPERLLRGLYRQAYCGCVFSEAERFAPTGRYLYKGKSSGSPSPGD